MRRRARSPTAQSCPISRSYLSHVCSASDIHEHFEIGARSARGYAHGIREACSLLCVHARMESVSTVSRRRTVRTARCSAEWISTCEWRSHRASRQHKVSRQPRRAVRQGLVGGGDAAHPDRLLTPLARNADGGLEPVSWERRSTDIARAIRATQATPRPRRCRCVRRRLADQRKGVSAGQVRARGARHVEHRLQRPILHVVGGRRRVEARSASIAACRFRSKTFPAPK